MDIEEIQREIDKLVNYLGTAGEELFTLAVALERTYIFQNIQTLIQQKDSSAENSMRQAQKLQRCLTR